MSRKLIAGLALLCLVPAPAFAHIVPGDPLNLHDGFVHPFTGLDHVVTMIAVGLYAAMLGGRSLWLLPAAFMSVMLAGGALGYAGVPLPLVEQAIGASVVVMSLAVAAGVRIPTIAATALVGAFALFHGHAHGTEGAALASFLPYAAGFVAATALLHLAGIGVGLGLSRLDAPLARTLQRIAGAAGTLAGVAMLAGAG